MSYDGHYQKPKNQPNKSKQIEQTLGKDVENLENVCTVGGNEKWYIHGGKQYGDSSKN
jgi:hypothetical protein